MPEQATPQQMNRFVKEVDEFFANYAKLINPATRAEVYSSGNPALVADYESAVSQGRVLRGTINATVGAWGAAKAAWSSVTGVTSTVIGDVADWFRGIFGYQAAPGIGAYSVSPISGGQLGALGAIQLPMAAAVAAIIASAFLLNSAMEKIFISMQATKMQRDDPTLSRADAVDRAAGAVRAAGLFGGGLGALPLIAAAALAAFLLFGRK